MAETRLDATRLLPAVVVAASVVLGLCVAVGGPIVAAFLALLLFAPLVIAPRRARVVVAALLLVALVNGVPFVDFASFNASGSFNFQDPVLLLLFALGVFELISRPGGLAGVVPRWVGVLVGLFTASWLTSVLLGVFYGTPALKAVLYGRDLLAVWLIVVVALIARDRRDVGIVLGILVGASAVFSAAHAAQVVLGINTSIITHPKKVTQALGFARLYAAMIPMTVYAFFVTLGCLLWGRSSRLRTAAVLAIAVIGAEQLLQLTRANYIALVVALLAGSLAAFASGSVRWGVGRAGYVLVGLSATLLGGYALSLSALASSPIVMSIQARIASTATDITTAGGNVGFRLVVYAEMAAVLGNQWLLGLGFQHPEYHWFASLPDGSLRNTDVGAMSVLMTQGIVGLIPLLILGVAAVVRCFRAMHTSDWLVKTVSWSCLCLVVVALVSAPTLGYFSTLPGLTATACAVGLMCRVSSDEFDTAAGGDAA